VPLSSLVARRPQYSHRVFDASETRVFSCASPFSPVRLATPVPPKTAERRGAVFVCFLLSIQQVPLDNRLK